MLSLNIVQRPWLVMGDFNTPFDFDHRVNGNLVTSVELHDGRAYMQTLGLITLRSVGQKYSWTKRVRVNSGSCHALTIILETYNSGTSMGRCVFNICFQGVQIIAL